MGFDSISPPSSRATPTGPSTPPDPPRTIAADPVLPQVRLIAEPWDASGAHQLGKRLPGITWAQWNARFRDDVRRFVRGDRALPALMTRLYGSDDLFPDDLIDASVPSRASTSSPPTTASRSTISSYTTESKRGERRGQRDGMAENYSWNCGWEGTDGAPPEVISMRKRQAKNLCCLLLLANGIPMICAGDEFLHTQAGNNNPYNQDNETSWLDWARCEATRITSVSSRG